MIRKLLLATTFVIVAAGTVQAQEFNFIETRQAGQDLLSGNYAGIRAVVAAKGDVTKLEDPAKALARWMKQFPTTFPAGSDKGPTKALPSVWADRAGFHQAADNFVASAEKLAQLAKAGDADGVAAQVKVVGDACSACHRTYRQR
jgi:cytochrome c556